MENQLETPIDKNLADIRHLVTTWSRGDANAFLQAGGRLIGITTWAAAEEDPEQVGVRFHVGFTKEEKDLPLWAQGYSFRG